MQESPSALKASYLHDHGRYKGILGWILSTDHKRIGLLYLYSIATMFVVGALLGLAMKFELLAPQDHHGSEGLQCHVYGSRCHHDLYDCDTRFACSFWQFSAAPDDRCPRRGISQDQPVVVVLLCCRSIPGAGRLIVRFGHSGYRLDLLCPVQL